MQASGIYPHSLQYDRIVYTAAGNIATAEYFAAIVLFRDRFNWKHHCDFDCEL